MNSVDNGVITEKWVFEEETMPSVDDYELGRSVLVAIGRDSRGWHQIRSYGGSLIRITTAVTEEEQAELLKQEGYPHPEIMAEEWQERFFDRNPKGWWRGPGLPF